MKNTPTWQLKINFVSFESDDQRDRSYELWAKSLKSFKMKGSTDSRHEAINNPLTTKRKKKHG